jgi:hypothetical protein
MNSWPVRYDPGIWIIHHKKDKITIGSFVLVTIIEETLRFVNSLPSRLPTAYNMLKKNTIVMKIIG